LGKLFAHISLTKQYNLVPVTRQRCPATGKVTVGLASHWPCVTNLSGWLCSFGWSGWTWSNSGKEGWLSKVSTGTCLCICLAFGPTSCEFCVNTAPFRLQRFIFTRQPARCSQSTLTSRAVITINLWHCH